MIDHKRCIFWRWNTLQQIFTLICFVYALHNKEKAYFPDSNIEFVMVHCKESALRPHEYEYEFHEIIYT
jgi:hypothetical protein